MAAPAGAWAGERDLVELGRRLFLDPTVSRAARFSCADCHRPEHGFSDPRARSVDENGPTDRHSQPLLDLNDGTGMHWDGEFYRVRELLVARLAPLPEAQQQAVLLAQRHFAESRGRGADESAFSERVRTIAPTPPAASWAAPSTVTRAAPLTRRLAEEKRYDAGFRRAFGSTSVTTERMVEAMEAYVLSLRSGTSPFDRYRGGDIEALSAPARRGFALFTGKADCASCHQLEGKRPRFTDDAFHNTGVAFLVDAVDDGRLQRSFVADERGAFKTPSLRDVARRAPYMHSGVFATLKEVVAYYAHGGTKNPQLDKRIRKLDLTEEEIDDLVAFLESLTSDERPGVGPYSRDRGHELHVRVEHADGSPAADLDVRVTPFGDRLGRAPLRTGEPFTLRTDPYGRISFRFPDWTHVTLDAAGYSLGEGQPLPDYLKKATVLAVPSHKTVVRVRSERSLGKTLTARVDGESVTFTRIRRLGARHGLYEADEPLRDVQNLFFREAPRTQFEVRCGEGLATLIDFREDPNLAPPARRGGGVLSRSIVPSPSGVEPVGEARLRDR